MKISSRFFLRFIFLFFALISWPRVVFADELDDLFAEMPAATTPIAPEGAKAAAMPSELIDTSKALSDAAAAGGVSPVDQFSFIFASIPMPDDLRLTLSKIKLTDVKMGQAPAISVVAPEEVPTGTAAKVTPRPPKKVIQKVTLQMVSGNIIFDGVPTRARILWGPIGKSTAVSVSIELAKNLKISDIPGVGLKDFDFLKLGHASLTFSSFDYLESYLGDVAIRRGANLVAKIGFGALQGAGSYAFNSITGAMSETASGVWLAGVIKPQVKESLFSIQLPHTSFPDSVSLSSLFTDMKIPLPASVENEFKKVVFRAPSAVIDISVGVQHVLLDGAVELFGKIIQGTFVAESRKKMPTMMVFRVQMPDNWNFGDTFAELKDTVKVPFTKPGFLISNQEYIEPESGMKIMPGLNFVAELSLAQLPSDPVFNQVKKIVSKVTDTLRLHGVITPNVKDSYFQAMLLAKQEPMIPLPAMIPNDVLNLIPGSIRDELNKVNVKKPTLDLVLGKTQQKLTIKGGARIYNNDIDANLLVQPSGVSLTLIMPKEWNPSQSAVELRDFDGLLNKAIFVLSTFPYKNTELNASIKKGLTIVSDINLTGAFKDLNNFIMKISQAVDPKGVFYVEPLGKVVFNGSLSSDIMSSNFDIVIPLRMGVNLEKTVANPKDVPLGIKKIYTDDFVAGVQLNLTFKLGTGVGLSLMTQPDPIKMRAEVALDPKSISIAAYLDGMLDPAFGLNWLSLGELGAQVSISYAPPWIEQLGFRGKMNFGEGTKITQIDIAFNINIHNPLAFLLFAKGQDISIEQIVWFFGKLIGEKNPPSMGSVPIFNLQKIDMNIAPRATVVAGKTYQEGLWVNATINMLGVTGNIDVQCDKTGISGSGGLANIKTGIIDITGSTPDKPGPSVGLVLNMKEQKMFIDGALSIPALQINSVTQFEVLTTGLKCTLNYKAGGVFDSYLTLNADLKNPRDFVAKVGYSTSVFKLLDEALEKELVKFKTQADKDITTLQSTIDKNWAQLTAAEQSLSTQAGQDKRRKELEALIAAKHAEIAKCKWYEVDCSISKGLEIAAWELEKAALPAAPAFIGAEKAISTEVLKMSRDVAKAGTTALSEMARALTRMVGGVIRFTGIQGELTGRDIEQGKMLKVNIQWQFMGNDQPPLTDLQFNWADPIGSMGNIAKQIIRAISGKDIDAERAQALAAATAK